MSDDWSKPAYRPNQGKSTGHQGEGHFQRDDSEIGHIIEVKDKDGKWKIHLGPLLDESRFTKEVKKLSEDGKVYRTKSSTDLARDYYRIERERRELQRKQPTK